jgi:hypothetical protein
MNSRFRVFALALVVVAGVAVALTTSAFTTSPQSRYPALDAITVEDLRADVFRLADDDFRGREAGTMDELRAAAWLAGKAREIGLVPMGDDGSYFQYFPLRRIRVSEASPIEIGEERFEVWKDAILLSPVDAVVDDELLWVGDTPNEELDESLIRGRAVAAMTLEPTRGPSPDQSLFEWRYARAAARERAQALIVKGAVAVVLVSDSISDSVFDMVAQWQRRGSMRIDSGESLRPSAGTPPVVAVRTGRLGDVSRGQRIRAAISTESFVFPSANVVAAVPGTDPSVADEYILFSGHHDHDGVRWPVDGDSIYNGADDNVSACAALLAIGRAFVQNPGRRGALFVFHGAEEKGLFGSRYFAGNPTVPIEKIAAVLNADMIARNHPDSAAILGMLPPNRNSSDLVEMALAANDDVAGFALDQVWDQPDHPEGFYFRSDHAPYSQRRVPALFYTSLLHPDYHTPRDGPELLDYRKLHRFTRWMYATGWRVAQVRQRPRIDEGWEYRR